MAYIESILYYTVITVIMFLVVFGLLILVYWFFGQFKLLSSKDGQDNFSFVAQKNLLFSLIKHKVFKVLVFLYFGIAFFTYINLSIHYYGKDRAYPQAKAYAIVADSISFWQAVLLGIKINHSTNPFNKKYWRILYPYSPLDQKIQAIQSYLLNKMYLYIPKDDGERDLLYYKYKLHYIATMDYKFMREIDYKIFGDGIVASEFGVYTPKQTEVHTDMMRINKNLSTKPIKDKVFDQVDRYTSIFRMSHYIAHHFSSMPNLKKMHYIPRYRIFENNATAFSEYTDFINEIDKLYTKEYNNTALREELNRTPLTKAFVLGALLKGMENIISYQIKQGIYPCGSQESKRYLFYHKEYDELAHSKKATKFIKGYYEQLHSYFYAAKYICGEKLGYVTKEEKRLNQRNTLMILNPEKDYIHLMEFDGVMNGFRAKEMRKLKEKIND